MGSLIRKYQISNEDIMSLKEIEMKKQSCGFLEKEKLKAASMKILKPYKVKFLDLGNLINEIKNGEISNADNSPISEDASKQSKPVELKPHDFPNSRENSNQIQEKNTKKNFVLIILGIIFFVGMIGMLIDGDDTPSACDCVKILDVPTKQVGIGMPHPVEILPDEEFRKYKKCYDKYAGPASATLECAEQ